MVSYGTWHDSPEFVETHRPRVNGDGPYIEYDTSQPYGPSGWGFFEETYATRDAEASTQQFLEGDDGPGLNPEFGSAVASIEAWDETRDMTTLFDASASLNQIALEYRGSVSRLELGGVGSQVERWTETDWRGVLAYGGWLGADWPTILAGPVEEWPAGAVGVELENQAITHPNEYVQLLDVTLQPWTALADGAWALSLKDAGNLLPPYPTYGPNFGVDAPLDLDAMRQIVIDHETAPGITSAMPFFTIEWVGDWPGDFGGPNHTRLVTDVVIEVVIRYKAPRWRFVFDSVVPVTEKPYRRTFPNDAATEGARRTFPPSRAIQAGRRTSGGYV